MNNSKKIILLSLVPFLLTLFFIYRFTYPAIQNYSETLKSIKAEKAELKTTQGKINELERNNLISKELTALGDELMNYDIEFPAEFQDEVLLIDLEQFADTAKNKILTVEAQNEKIISMDEPQSTKKGKKGKKSGKKKKKSGTEEKSPVEIYEKPYKITSLAYYNELIDFVSYIESYQRKININGIKAEVYEDDKTSPSPRLQLEIEGSVYKTVVNPQTEEQKNDTEKEKNNSDSENNKNKDKKSSKNSET